MLRKIAAAVVMASAIFGAASAQEFPNKAVRLVVAFEAGGAVDTLTRRFAPILEKELGQPVVVENKPGAATMIGTMSVANGPTDGHTVLMTTNISVIRSATPGSDFDIRDHLSPVFFLGYGPYVISVRADSPFKTWRELADHARANPERTLKIGATGGIGAGIHLLGQRLAGLEGIKLIAVPYNGTASAIRALLTGEIDVSIDGITLIKQQIAEGVLRGIAVTTAERTGFLTDVPGMIENGLPDVDTGFWTGAFVRKGTPEPFIDKLNTALNAAFSDPDYKAYYENTIGKISGGSPEDFNNVVERDIATWSEIMKGLDIKVEN